MILPVLPLALVFSLAVAVAGTFSEPAGHVLSWATWPWLSWMTGVIRIFSWVPGFTVDAGPTGPYLSLVYYGLGLFLLWLARRRWLRALVQSELPEFPTLRTTAKPSLSTILRQKRTIFLVLVILLTIGVFSVAAVRPTERLRVTILDVGQGESILIQGPDRLTVLVDGGPNPAALVLELGQRLPHWQRSVDLVVLTHPDSDHLSGLMGLLERYDVDHVIQCGAGCTTAGNEADFLSWTALLGRKRNLTAGGRGRDPGPARAGHRYSGTAPSAAAPWWDRRGFQQQLGGAQTGVRRCQLPAHRRYRGLCRKLSRATGGPSIQQCDDRTTPRQPIFLHARVHSRRRPSAGPHLGGSG